MRSHTGWSTAEKEPVGGSNIVVLLRGYVRYTGGLT